jgi:hypothetical protein
MRRCGAMGCCDAGLAGAAGLAGELGAEAAGAAGLAGAAVAGGCTGGVTTTAGGATGFSGVGAAGAVAAGGAAGLATGGVTRTVFSGTTALVADAGASGAGGGAAGGFTAAIGGRAGTTAGLAAAEGCCCCCSRSRNSLRTSPGLEILERSILGLISDAPAFSFEAGADLAEKCLRIFSASSSSTELEWVFFSVIPSCSNTSRMALLFTSSSLARSLIRIFIRSVFPPSARYALISTSRL